MVRARSWSATKQHGAGWPGGHPAPAISIHDLAATAGGSAPRRRRSAQPPTDESSPRSGGALVSDVDPRATIVVEPSCPGLTRSYASTTARNLSSAAPTVFHAGAVAERHLPHRKPDTIPCPALCFPSTARDSPPRSRTRPCPWPISSPIRWSCVAPPPQHRQSNALLTHDPRRSSSQCRSSGRTSGTPASVRRGSSPLTPVTVGRAQPAGDALLAEPGQSGVW